MIRIILVAVVLAGCGPQYSEDNHGYGWEFSEQSSLTGTRVRYYDAASPRIDEIDAWYLETKSCVEQVLARQVSPARGTLVVFTPNVPDDDNALRTGLIYYDTGLVLIENSLVSPIWRDLVAHCIKHEFVHWLLYWAGENAGDHGHPAFLSCAPNALLPII